MKGPKRTRPYEDPVKKALVIQLGQLRVNSAKVLRGPAVGPLHDLRVAALRACFALKFFSKYIRGGKDRKLQGHLAHARRIMGKQRDLDIFSCRIRKDFKVLNISTLEKQRLSKVIAARKAKARKKLTAMLNSDGYKDMLQGLKHAASGRDQKQLRPKALLKDLFDQVASKKGQTEDLHKLRKTMRNLRYACEFLVDQYDKEKMSKVIRTLVEVQNELGLNLDARDAARLLSRLNEAEESKSINRLIDIEKTQAHNAYEKFRKIWKSMQYRRIFATLESGRKTGDQGIYD